MAETITEMLQSGQRDLAWFDKNLQSLVARYEGKFIAIQNQQVLDADADLDKLLTKLRKQGIDTSRVFVEFVSRIKTIL